MKTRWERRCSQRRKHQARAAFARQGGRYAPGVPGLSLPNASLKTAPVEASGASDLGMLAALLPLLLRGGRRKG